MQEPGAVVPHAGICAGGAGQPASLPRTDFMNYFGNKEESHDFMGVPFFVPFTEMLQKLPASPHSYLLRLCPCPDLTPQETPTTCRERNLEA
jgi:hypothetical protein